ncbi:hypothetical protein C7S14_2405 [Burkholderia cepacia]|nr:hypothetical protein C7S14_2405 [Burkholderia cepacia]
MKNAREWAFSGHSAPAGNNPAHCFPTSVNQGKKRNKIFTNR